MQNHISFTRKLDGFQIPIPLFDKLRMALIAFEGKEFFTLLIEI